METKKVKSTKTPNKPMGTRGRPTVMTQDVLTRLQLAFETGASDREATLFAGIDEKTLYNYQEKNPEYVQQKEQWKDKPLFIARQAVIKDIQNGNGDLALKYLERKKKDEFAPKSSIDLGITADLDKKLEDIKNFIYPESKK